MIGQIEQDLGLDLILICILCPQGTKS
jgi:hypothetical protein